MRRFGIVAAFSGRCGLKPRVDVPLRETQRIVAAFSGRCGLKHEEITSDDILEALL